MKIRITLKDPDGVFDSIREASENSMDDCEGLDQMEREEICEKRAEQISEKCKKWIKFGEYVNIEIDTEAGTAIVREA